MIRLVTLAAISLLLTSCRSREESNATSLKSETENSVAVEIYETVNIRPQFSVDNNQFYFYWGLWRRMSDVERRQMDTMPRQQASLISKRSVAWTLYDCGTNELLHQNREDFYFLDELKIQDGELKPVHEAFRPGWRYFSMGSFNSALAREDLGRPNLTQNPGETNREFRDRKAAFNIDWLSKQSRIGQKGEVILQAEHRFFAVNFDEVKKSFVVFEDYRQNDTVDLAGKFAPFNPSRWPVLYDERAHKPHSFKQPDIWNTSNVRGSTRQFGAKLIWNWCEAGDKPKAQFEIDAKDLPPPGPNRPGRTDAGNTELPIVSKKN